MRTDCRRASRISAVSIGHQNDILVHNRRDHLSQGICVDRGQNCTDCRAAAISDNQETGTCSSDRPRLLALPPLRRALRSRFRAPFRLSSTQVSSASTMPVSLRAFRSFAARNRCRQRKAVLTASPQRFAEARTVSPSARQAPKESHLSLRCRPDKGVPVAALNVFLHPFALVPSQTPCLATRYGSWRATMRALAIFTHGRFNGSQRR